VGLGRQAKRRAPLTSFFELLMCWGPGWQSLAVLMIVLVVPWLALPSAAGFLGSVCCTRVWKDFFERRAVI